jgi:tetratricopeptide (TPR) repeat protein
MTAASSVLRGSVATSVVFAVELIAGVALLAQQTPAPPPPDASKYAPEALESQARKWRAAARAHVSGKVDDAALSIARWPTELTRVVLDREVLRLQDERAARRERRAGGDDDSTAVIAKGILLHTDIAIVERNVDLGGTSTAVDPLLVDAKPLESRRFSSHWAHARLLADALGKYSTEAAARDAIATPTIAVARAWYRAAGALFQESADLGHLDRLLTDSDGVFPDDPVLLLYRGTLHQAYADARLQVYLTQLLSSRRDPDVAIPLGRLIDGSEVLGGRVYPFRRADAELAIAERALRRAIEIDASLVEARIRLAHVLDARGKPAEAAELARQAIAEPLPPFLDYYGAMVLGRAEAAIGHHVEAQTAFERAAARYPRSQAARVALSHLAIGGSTGMAAGSLVKALGPDVQERADDPWSQYFRLHVPDAQTLLDALRTLVP